jgi:hypothetical protein
MREKTAERTDQENNSVDRTERMDSGVNRTKRLESKESTTREWIDFEQRPNRKIDSKVDRIENMYVQIGAR